MDVRLRPYQAEDFDFARQLYFETMRWAIERLFGWNQVQQEASFDEWFIPDEVSIIVANDVDVGWIQRRLDHDALFLGSIYVTPRWQRRGIGTRVIKMIFDLARRESRPVTLAVMKINPVFAFYERFGFRPTHEDEYKVYMRADAAERSTPS